MSTGTQGAMTCRWQQGPAVCQHFVMSWGKKYKQLKFWSGFLARMVW